ncbi:MAG: RNA-directed DNA polymerase [Planctomycetaceae bacterium]|nr:RNA-directed DNA polymerase [Planctomycetaceae bacterium]
MNFCNVTARALSAAFLAGDFDVDGLVVRGSRVLGKRRRWLRPLARRAVETFAGRPRPRRVTLAEFILGDPGFLQASRRHGLRPATLPTAPSIMCPVGAAESWQIPSIRSAGELADWLGVTIGELEWFADRRSLEYKWNHGRLRHYHYRPLTKRSGQVRMVEAPKPRLKAIQRRILAGILDHIPLHDAAHGFRRGRSINTFASPHAGKRVVLKIDLHDFFPSIRLARIQALFRTIGYPEEVADLLAGLCTNATPPDVWEADTIRLAGGQLQEACWLYSQPHLPQGAPTSPALANLCAYRLDCRLHGLAQSAHAVYTRYADDLAFSGDRDFERAAKRFHLHVCATVMEEGFSVHHRKTRIMRQGVRQRLTGLVVNERLNVSRRQFDCLKATLTNCIRFGPQSQNRSGHGEYRAHLDGRISFVETINPARGHRLRELFDRIEWPERD